MRKLCLHLKKTQPELKREVATEKKAELFLFIKFAVDPIPSPEAWQQNWTSDQEEIYFFLPLFSQAARKQQAQDGSKLRCIYNLTTGSHWALNKPESIYLSDAWLQPFLMTSTHMFFSSVASFSGFMIQERHHCIKKKTVVLLWVVFFFFKVS